MRSVKLYNKASTGKIKVLEISVSEDKLTTRWGYQGMKMQETTETGKGKNVGRANEVSASENAEDLFDRKVKKKKESGYVEDISLLEKVNNPWKLSDKFCAAKPKASITDAALQKLIDERNCIATVKHDGQRCYIYIMPDGAIHIMSRRMKSYTDLLPHICASIAASNVPKGSILDAELVKDVDKDDYDYVSSILRSKPNKAIEKQQNDTPLFVRLFDVLYWDNMDITLLSYANRLSRILAVSNHNVETVESRHIENRYQLDLLMDRVIDSGGEGLVICEASAPTKLRWDGKPDRAGKWKMKPSLRDEFFVTNYEMGTGKHEKVVGALFISQYDKDGNIINCGKVGCMAGSSDIRKDLLQENLKDGSLVVEVEFNERQKSGALRFPVLQRIRRDKTPEECIYLPEAK